MIKRTRIKKSGPGLYLYIMLCAMCEVFAPMILYVRMPSEGVGNRKEIQVVHRFIAVCLRLARFSPVIYGP